jgi:uncharacterized integral membrane protein
LSGGRLFPPQLVAAERLPCAVRASKLPSASLAPVDPMNGWLLVPAFLVVILASLVFAVQNAGPVTVVLFGARYTLPLGVLLLGALFAGSLAAGLVLWAGLILPLRLRLRRGGRDAPTDGSGGAAA